MKSPEPMAFVRLDDLEGSIEVVVVPQVLAAARELLIQAAMVITGDNARDNYSATRAVVTYNGPNVVPKRSWTYGELSASAGNQTVPDDLRLTTPGSFRLIGKPTQALGI